MEPAARRSRCALSPRAPGAGDPENSPLPARPAPGPLCAASPSPPGPATGMAQRGRDTACPTGMAPPELLLPALRLPRPAEIEHSPSAHSIKNTADTRAGHAEPRAPSTYPCAEAIGGRGRDPVPALLAAGAELGGHGGRFIDVGHGFRALRQRLGLLVALGVVLVRTIVEVCRGERGWP